VCFIKKNQIKRSTHPDIFQRGSSPQQSEKHPFALLKGSELLRKLLLPLDSGPFYLAHGHIKIQTLKTLTNN